MKHMLMAAAILGLTAAPAFAFHCPVDMKMIDAALAGDHGLSAAQIAEVKAQRAEGETLHKAGNHQGAVDVLAKALKTLGNE